MRDRLKANQNARLKKSLHNALTHTQSSALLTHFPTVTDLFVDLPFYYNLFPELLGLKILVFFVNKLNIENKTKIPRAGKHAEG